MGIDPNERSPRGATRPRSGEFEYVKVDMVAAIKMLGGLEAIAGLGKQEILRRGAEMMNQDIRRAFDKHADPSTGRAWPPRTRTYPWEILERTGTLKGMVDAGWGLHTRDRIPALFGRVRDGSYLGGYTRGGAQQHKPTQVVAGAVQFGRKKARSSRGTRLRGASPATGITPPRPYLGFSRSSRDRFKQEILRQLKKAAGD